MNVLAEIWNTMGALSPSLILGLLIAGLLHVFVRKERILSHLGEPGFRSSAKAALVGVPLPLCSCGVLPAALSLRRDGASQGSVTSFLISTPQTGVDSIAVTWGVLGFPVAAAKVIAAFAAGLIGGTLADRYGGTSANIGAATGCAEDENGSLVSRIWNYSFGTIFRDIYRWLLFGIIVSVMITLFLEPGQLSQYPILSGPLGLVAALLLGIPLYVCSIASVPIAAGLIYAGFPVGSALVFLMAGPATNAATMGAVRKSLGGKVFLIYLLTVITVSIAAGILLNSIDIPISSIHGHDHGAGAIRTFTATSASILLAAGILFYTISDLRSAFSGFFSRRSDSRVVTIHIIGMSCSMCERKVQDLLKTFPFVEEARVSAKTGTAIVSVTGKNSGSVRNMIEAIEKSGYRVEGGTSDA